MDISIFPPRKRPQVIPDPKHYPPKLPQTVRLFDPAQTLPFLHLPALDPCPDPVLERFGVLHDTARTACQILAFNEPGFLSTSRSREDQDARVSEDADFVLPPRCYYYHLRTPTKTPYPICHDFQQWSFPHDSFPPSWAVPSPLDPEPILVGLGDIDKDKACRVTRSKASLVTVQLVSEDQEKWFNENDMYVYLSSSSIEYYQDPYNLFTLRADIYSPLFEQACFAIVPKGGQLAVQFLCGSCKEYARCYHNVAFDHGEMVSRPLLYARFAWSVIFQSKALLR